MFLFFETAKVIGQPDAGDWGGLYVEIKCVGEPVQYWFIDQKKRKYSIISPYIC